MTYISIRPEIETHVQAGRLQLVGVILPGPYVRPMYMVPAVYSEIFGPWDPWDGTGRNQEKWLKRMGLFQRDIDRFTRGERLTVGHGYDKNCELKPLERERDEIWEFRSRAPDPGLRLFGRFAEKDVFIATNLAIRPLLKGRRSREWAIEIAACHAEWRKLFPYCNPHQGNDAHDYVSNVIELGDIESR